MMIRTHQQPAPQKRLVLFFDGTWNKPDIPGISTRTLRFHNTRLSKVVEQSYQALALDEHRKHYYWGILWTNFVPDPPAGGRFEEQPEHERQDDRLIEQRWFSGAHCDVGGGYRNDVMSQRPLAWLQERARGCGLAFRSRIQIIGDDDLDVLPHDSYREILRPIYSLIFKPYVRSVMSDPVRKPNGCVHTVNERIDPSVFARCRKHTSYRPQALRDWARRRSLDLEEVIETANLQELYCAPVTAPGVEAPPNIMRRAEKRIALAGSTVDVDESSDKSLETGARTDE